MVWIGYVIFSKPSDLITIGCHNNHLLPLKDVVLFYPGIQTLDLLDREISNIYTSFLLAHCLYKKKCIRKCKV